MSEIEEISGAGLVRSNRRFSEKIIYISISLALLVFLGSFGFVLAHSHNNEKWRVKAMSGQVAMTESQLVGLVRDQKINAYWAGPRVGYLYTLDNTVKNRAILSYVESKVTTTKTDLNSRLIATYYSKGAFASSVVAAGKAENTGFRNADGSVVFYQSAQKRDVYLAFPKSDYQIEIYDSTLGQALSLAILKDQITKIGA